MTPYVVILCAVLNLMVSVASIDQSTFQTEKSLASDSKTLASPRFKEQTTDAVAIAAMILAIPDLKTLSGKLSDTDDLLNKVLFWHLMVQ